MKLTIKNALKGLLLVPLVAFGIATAVPFAQTSAAPTDNLTIKNGANSAKGDDQSGCLFTADNCTGDPVFKNVTNVMLFIIGAISVIMLIIGGIRYTVSGGDSSAVTGAKNTILYAIVGIVVALLAFAVVNFVLGSFGNSN